MGYFSEFLLLAPIYLFGLLTNYIPYILPGLVFKVLKLDIEYKTAVQMIVGLFTFPLFYWLEIKLIGSYFSIDFWMSCLLLISFVISAYIAMYYRTEVKRFRRVLHFYFFMKPGKKVSIINLRDEILANIEIATSKNIDIRV